MNPLVTVIIPTFNFGHLIGFALESVIQQSYSHWECIIIDDGSTDDTEQTIAAYTSADRRIKYYKQKNQGPGEARNEGLRKAKGEFIQFLDADDILQPFKLAEQMETMLSNPDIDVVYSTAVTFVSDVNQPQILLNIEEEQENYRPKITGSGKDVVKAFLQNSIFPSASLVKYSVVKEMQLLNKALAQSEDWDLYLRMAWAGKHFHFISSKAGNSSALIRKHADNNTLNFYRLQYYVIKMRQLFDSYCTDIELRMYNQELINYNLEQLVTEVVSTLKNNNRKLAIERAFKILGLKWRIRYFVYAVASLFLSADGFEKLAKASLSK